MTKNINNLKQEKQLNTSYGSESESPILIKDFNISNVFTSGLVSVEFVPIFKTLHSLQQIDGYDESGVATFLNKKLDYSYCHKTYLFSYLIPAIKRGIKVLQEEGRTLNYKNLPIETQKSIKTFLNLFTFDEKTYEKVLKRYRSKGAGDKYIKKERLLPLFKKIQAERTKKPISKEALLKLLDKAYKKHNKSGNLLQFLGSVNLNDLFKNNKKAVFLSEFFNNRVIFNNQYTEAFQEKKTNQAQELFIIDLKKDVDYKSFLAFYPKISKKDFEFLEENLPNKDGSVNKKPLGCFYFTIKDLLEIVFNDDFCNIFLSFKDRYPFPDGDFKNLYRENLKFLDNFEDLKDTHPYTYKMVKKYVPLLKFLNEDGLNKADFSLYNLDFEEINKGEIVKTKRHIFFASISYLLKNLGLDNQRRRYISSLSGTLSLIGLLDIVDPFDLPKKLLNKSITEALSSGKKYSIRYFSIPLYKEAIDNVEYMAKRLYESGFRVYVFMSKNKNSIEKASEEFKNQIIDLIKEKNIDKARALSDIYYLFHKKYRIASSTPEVRDLIEYSRDRSFRESLDAMRFFGKVAGEIEESNSNPSPETKTENVLVMAEFFDTHTAEMTLDCARDARIGTNGFYEFINYAHMIMNFGNYQVDEEFLKKDTKGVYREFVKNAEILEDLRRDMELYMSYCFFIKIPNKEGVTKRLAEIENIRENNFKVPWDKPQKRLFQYIRRFDFFKILTSSVNDYGKFSIDPQFEGYQERYGKDPKEIERQIQFLFFALSGEMEEAPIVFDAYRKAYNAYTPFTNLSENTKNYIEKELKKVYKNIKKTSGPKISTII